MVPFDILRESQFWDFSSPGDFASFSVRKAKGTGGKRSHMHHSLHKLQSLVPVDIFCRCLAFVSVSQPHVNESFFILKMFEKHSFPLV